jgi:hypothetical protein
MRVNTKKSVETANAVHDRFGSWSAAKESANFENGKFVVEGKWDSKDDCAARGD